MADQHAPGPGGSSDDGRTGRLAAADKAHLWHPFTQMSEWLASDPLIVERAEGCWLVDTDGRRYFDGVSSLWCNVHGHRHPRLDTALAAQAAKAAHTTMLGMSNPAAIELASMLAEISPEALTRVFYAENGASAVEIALKMAFQFWRHRGEQGRDRFVCLEHAYHGDTLGAVSVGGIDVFHAAFGPLLFPSMRAPSPFPYRSPLGEGDPEACRDACLAELDRMLEDSRERVAAVIVEPLVQGAAGMIVHPEGYLAGVREACDRWGTLLICDEVATGFGRTGSMFACEQEEVAPDLMVVGKGLTGGYLPLSAVVATEEVFGAFLGEYDEFKTFFHGHTYTGNPLACAVATANLEVFSEEGTLEAVGPKADRMAVHFERIGKLAHVGEVRQKGLMAGVELVADKESKREYEPSDRVAWRVCRKALEHGVAIRPLGDVVVLMPPLAATAGELDLLCEAVESSIEEVAGSD